jgi:hypothetical protein
VRSLDDRRALQRVDARTFPQAVLQGVQLQHQSAGGGTRAWVPVGVHGRDTDVLESGQRHLRGVNDGGEGLLDTTGLVGIGGGGRDGPIDDVVHSNLGSAGGKADKRGFTGI